MRKYILNFWNTEEIPHEAKVLTAVTSIRWIGWGFAESLIPVLLYSFGHTYAQAGLLRSAYDIAFIVSLPLVGVFADRIRATTLILTGLFLYLFCGLAYFLAGITGVVVFIVLARGINGVAYALDAVGRDTCIRRHTTASKLATVFGYLNTVANFWWIAASLFGILLVKYFSITSLLFLITPTALISIGILMKFRKKKNEKIGIPERAKVPLSSFFKEMKLWNIRLKSLLLFNFFISFTGAIIIFFLPIQAYIKGEGFSFIILMGIVMTLPTLFDWQLGKLFDGKGVKIFTQSLFLFSALIFSLVFFSQYAWQLVVLFVVNLIIQLLSLGANEMVTVHAEPEHFGRVDGIMQSISDIGSMLGPITIGIIMDAYSVQLAYSILGTIILALAIIFYTMNKRGFMKNNYI
jgi:MFS family permease